MEYKLNDSYYIEYNTLVNGKFYTITFIKNNKYYDYEIYEIEEIINSIDIKFDEKESIDDSYEVSNSMIDSNVVGYVLSHMNMEDLLKNSIKKTIIYYIIGGIVGLIAFIIFLIKDKKDDKKFDW